MLAASRSCDCCGQPLGPKEGVGLDPADVWKAIQKRVNLDAHMKQCHPESPWTPLSPTHVERFTRRGLVQILHDNPEVQFDSLPAAPMSSIVDGPPRNKVRRIGEDHKPASIFESNWRICKWERITNQLLFSNHRDADSVWSLLVRHFCNGLVANHSHMRALRRAS